jgi:ribosomal protein L14E/L6E/L27E
MTGMFAVSMAGHDKGRMYLIVKEEDGYVFLADGETRTIENPKKKKRKHIQPVKAGMDEVLAEKLKNRQTIYNEEIKFAIKVRAK